MAELSKFQKTYTSFSGVDIIASITPPGSKSIVIGSIQTLSYSIHREKSPVRPLGHINPKGFTYGGRTIAGTMIFTVFDRNVIKDIFREMFMNPNPTQDKGKRYQYINYDVTDPKTTDAEKMWIEVMYQKMVTDELPPFDVNIIMQNEYGQGSTLTLMGVTLVDEGQVMSIEDLVVENTTSFMAMDIRVQETAVTNPDWFATPYDVTAELLKYNNGGQA